MGLEIYRKQEMFERGRPRCLRLIGIRNRMNENTALFEVIFL